MALSAARVKAEVRPGRYSDGDGLYLFVRVTTAQNQPAKTHKSWVLRYRQGGKQRDMGLGRYPEVSLSDARQAASQARQRRRAGDDPITTRRDERAAKQQKAKQAGERSFRIVAERYIAKHEPTWKNAQHRQQWRSTLAAHAYPKSVTRTLRRSTGRMCCRSWSQSGRRPRLPPAGCAGGSSRSWTSPRRKNCATANPARWPDLRHRLPNVKKLKQVEHQPALPWNRLPAFMKEVGTNQSITGRALAFLILTATRTNEVIGATWSEVNLEDAVWTIPSSRMKMSVVHRVPLSLAALRILQGLKPERVDPKACIFPGLRPTSHLSDAAMLQLVRRMHEKAIQQPDDRQPWLATADVGSCRTGSAARFANGWPRLPSFPIAGPKPPWRMHPRTGWRPPISAQTCWRSGGR